MEEKDRLKIKVTKATTDYYEEETVDGSIYINDVNQCILQVEDRLFIFDSRYLKAIE